MRTWAELEEEYGPARHGPGFWEQTLADAVGRAIRGVREKADLTQDQLNRHLVYEGFVGGVDHLEGGGILPVGDLLLRIARSIASAVEEESES